MSSHYDTLGVSREANQNEIKKAFRDLAKKHHPDVGGCETKFKAMSNAADILSNEEKRRFYDLSLKNQHGQYNFQTPKGQPRTHAWARRLLMAGLHQKQARLVVGNISMHRTDDAQIIREPGKLREQLTHHDATFAVCIELERRRHVAAGPTLFADRIPRRRFT